MSGILKKVLIAAGVATVAVVTYLFFNQDDPNPLGVPTSGGSKDKFLIKGTTQEAWQTKSIDVITGTDAHARAPVGGEDLISFTMPNAYAATTKAWWISHRALRSLLQVQHELVQNGRSLVLVDAWRSQAQQDKLRQEKPHLAAKDSNHVKGLAVDIRMYDPSVSGHWDIREEGTWGRQSELAVAMARHGWKQHPTEEWHFDFVG